MKIAIDLRPLQIGHQNRGIGMYLLNILQYMPQDKEYIYLRYDTSSPIEDYQIATGAAYREIVIPRHKFSIEPVQAMKFLLSLLKPVFPKVSRLHPDVFFQADYLLGTPRHRRSMKTVVVTYDLIPLRFKNLYLPSWRKFYRYKQFRVRSRVRLMVHAIYYQHLYRRGFRTLRRASSILSISETTRSDLIRMIGVKPAKIKTVYLAPSFLTDAAKPSGQVKNGIDPINNKYLLFIGGTDQRRKVHELVSAFNLLNSRGYDMHLVLAGSEFVEESKELNPKTRAAIESSSFIDKIHLLGKISEADKLYVLQNAAFFVYPTLFEGFGLPILEAMKARCPVITFKNEVTDEIAGNAVAYTSSPDYWGIYEAVLGLMGNKKLREELIRKGVVRCGDFDWAKTGKQTVEALLAQS